MNLIGKTFGRLIVVSKAPNIGHRIAWNCLCSCGTATVVLQQSLRNKATTSCGCFHRECLTDDLLNQRFGSWVVVGTSDKRSSDGSLYWTCKCDCGTSREVSSVSLKTGASSSCGCSRSRQICPYGHDTVIWGRAKDGMCRACLKNRNLLKKYGITLQEFFDLYEFQHGLCAVCGIPLGDIRPGLPGFGNGMRIEVDHEHGTIKPLKETVRGLLCGGKWKGCNRRLGRIDKGPWLSQASIYVTNPPARQLWQSS